MSGTISAPGAYDLLQQELHATAATPAPAAPAPATPAAASPSAYADLQATLNATRTDPTTVLGNLGLGVRDLVQGLASDASLPGLVYDTAGNLINLGERGIEGLTGADLAALRVHPAAENIDSVLDAAGLPKGAAQPGFASRLNRAFGATLGNMGTGAALSAAAPAGSVIGAAGNVLAAAPATQAVATTAPQIASLYTDPALKDHPELASVANAAIGLAAAGSMAGLNNLLAGPFVDPDIAQWAARARQLYNLPLSATDIGQSNLWRTTASVSRGLPGGGWASHDDAINGALTQAISNTIGENTTRITPDVMTAARERIGNELDRIGGVTTMQVDNPLLNQLGQIETDARSSTGTVPGATAGNLPPQMQAIQNQIDAVVNQGAANNGTIPGSIFQDMIKKGAPLDVVAGSSDPVVARYGQQIRDALFDAFERSSSADEVGNLQAARYQYKNMKTIEPLVEKAPTGGLSPALLQGAARSAFDDMAYSGGGQLGDLGQIGKLFYRAPPDSGTALRSFITGLMTRPWSAIPTAAVTAPLNRVAGSIMRSPAAANLLLSGTAPFTALDLPAAGAASLLSAQQAGQGGAP